MEKRSSHLSIRYDGEAHRNHEMDVLELSRSLDGLGNLVVTANSLLNGEETPIEIKVTGFNEGSFEYLIEVVQLAASHKDVLAILGISGATSAGALFEIVKKLKGRKIDVVKESPDSDVVELQVEGESIQCSRDVERLLGSKIIRKSVNELVFSPTRREGTDTFEIKESGQVTVSESKDTAALYKSSLSPYTERVSSEEFESQVKFLTAHADKSSKWRVEYAGKEWNVKVEDELFLERIQNQASPNIFGEKFTILLEKIVKEVRGKDPVTTLVIKRVYHKSFKK